MAALTIRTLEILTLALTARSRTLAPPLPVQLTPPDSLKATRSRLPPGTLGIDLNRHRALPSQRAEDLHQPVQREPTQTRVTNMQEIRARESRRRFGRAHRHCAPVQHHDTQRRLRPIGSFPETSATTLRAGIRSTLADMRCRRSDSPLRRRTRSAAHDRAIPGLRSG